MRCVKQTEVRVEPYMGKRPPATWTQPPYRNRQVLRCWRLDDRLDTFTLDPDHHQMSLKLLDQQDKRTTRESTLTKKVCMGQGTTSGV